MHIPGVEQVGGFSITTSPADVKRTNTVHLAVQKAPENPPAAWFWQEPLEKVRLKILRVRVGGSFYWPPTDVDPSTIRKVILVAGGVGIKYASSTARIPSLTSFTLSDNQQ